MSLLLKRSALFFFFFYSLLPAFAQDSTYMWRVTSKKISDKKYELIFTTDGSPGWQLYAPNQVIAEVPMGIVSLNDSSIKLDKEFVEGEGSRTFNSPIFDTVVRVYDDEVEWHLGVEFKQAVPAHLQGNLAFYFGNDEAFNTASVNFNVPLEGGVAATTKIRIDSLSLNDPVRDCGD